MKKPQKNKDIVRIDSILDLHTKSLQVSNHEMGVIKGDISLMQKDIQDIKEHVSWIKEVYSDWEEKFNKVESRTWQILASIIVGFLATIAMFVVALYFK